MLEKVIFLKHLRSPKSQVVNRIIYLTATAIIRQFLNNTFTRIIPHQEPRFIQNQAVESSIRRTIR